MRLESVCLCLDTRHNETWKFGFIVDFECDWLSKFFNCPSFDITSGGHVSKSFHFQKTRRELSKVIVRYIQLLKLQIFKFWRETSQFIHWKLKRSQFCESSYLWWQTNEMNVHQRQIFQSSHQRYCCWQSCNMTSTKIKKFKIRQCQNLHQKKRMNQTS